MEASKRPDFTVIPGGRSLPFNIEAEEAVLGGILFDPEAIDRVIDILTPESFYSSAHQEIYRTALALRSLNRATDMMNVLAHLYDRGALERAGGQNRLSELLNSIVSAVNVDQYAYLVQDKYLRRRLIKAGEEVSELAYNTDFSVEVILDQAEQRVFRVGQDTPTSGLVPTSQSVFETLSSIEARAAGEIPPGITCDFYDLDGMTQGFQRSDLIIIAGRPGQGKTAFVLEIARNIAKKHKLPIAVFSLEMPKDQINRRLLSAESGIEIGKLRSGCMDGDEWERLGQALQVVSTIPIAVDDDAVPSISAIRSRSRRYMAESGGTLGAIVIDYLQLMGGSDDSNRVQELSRITRGLKLLARELNVPVFALSQLSRGVETRTNKRPVMSDLRESGSIEQDADLIMMLYRDEYYNPDTPDRGIAEVIIVKHRNGATGTVKLLFDAQYTRFRNLARRSDGFDDMRVVRPDFGRRQSDRPARQSQNAVSPQLHDAAASSSNATQPEAESDSVDGWNVGDIAIIAIDHLDDYSQKEITKNSEVPVGDKALILGFEYDTELRSWFVATRLPDGSHIDLPSNFLRRVES